MLRGRVSSFNSRRGTGYVRRVDAGDAIPFSLRHADGTQFADGDEVHYTVVGGKAGVVARGVRRVSRAA